MPSQQVQHLTSASDVNNVVRRDWVHILHFNDCYDVEPKQNGEPKGGAACV